MVSVLFVTQSHAIGGAEQSLLDLIGRLPDTFCPVLACSKMSPIWAWAQGHAVKSLDTPVISPNEVGIRGKARRLIQTAIVAWKIFRHTRKEGIAILHANGLRGAVPSAIASVFSGLPLVVHLRDYPKHRFFLSSICRVASAVIAPSEFIRRSVIENSKVDQRKISVIGNPIPEPRCGATVSEFRSELREASSKILVTVVAQIVRWKRIDLFLEAASVLAKEEMGLHFLVVGSDLWDTNGAYRISLRERAERPDLKGRVSFLDQREDIGTILATSTITVLPSTREPFGRVVVEAWWMGSVVVASDDGAPAELIRDGETGFLFRSGDVEDLARTIGRAYRDPDVCSRVREQAYKEVHRFDPDLHAQKVIEVYRQILS